MGSPQLDAIEVESTASNTEGKDDNEQDRSTEEMTSTEQVDQKQGDVEESQTVSFNPPVYVQRYCRVRELLGDYLDSPKYKELFRDTGKTVMEVGCAEFGMMKHLKSLLDIGKILFVDIDKQLLQDNAHHLKPFPAEYLQRISRPQPLVIEAYAGCVTKVDPDVHSENPNIWAIVGIEIVEHLHADVLRGFEETVFGIISPHIVIVTTPNSDFNEVFNLPPGKFRHWDHKFEWSRKEFQLWCDKIVCEFTNYIYRIEGICEGPEETKHLGCVSQMAIFEKKDEGSKNEDAYTSRLASRIVSSSYTLISKVEFPNYIEKRTPAEIIVSELCYFINTYLFSTSMINEYDETETKEVTVPLTRVINIDAIAKAAKDDLSFLQAVLVNAGYHVKLDNLVINVADFIAANFVDDKSETSDEDQVELCEEINELDVNRMIQSDDEWD